jgi:phage host-nuclease inhibitor protein Gam
MNANQYNTINELLSQFSACSAAVNAAEAEIVTVQLAAAEQLLPKHAAAKIALADLEARLRKLSDEHYDELFPPEDKKRSHKTPFGTLKYNKSSSLEVDDEEKAILKIKVACTDELARESEGHPPRFTREQLIRTREELDLEALGKLDDLTLAAFGIKRVHKDNFKIAPFEMASDKPAKDNGKKQEAS